VLAVKEATRLKSVHPGVKVVFRGAHPSGDPEECLRNSAVDSAIAGEGEIAPRVRPEARYGRSLEVLWFAKSYRPQCITKSGASNCARL